MNHFLSLSLSIDHLIFKQSVPVAVKIYLPDTGDLQPGFRIPFRIELYLVFSHSAFLLNNYYNVSIAKTRQCISDLTNGMVTLSTGTICNLSSDFSSATESERAKIFSLLTHSDVLYSDATVSNINGTRKAVILCTDKQHVLFQHTDHKGHDGLSKTPVKNCEGVIVHDHDKSYYSYGSGHQECLAHVLRYLVGAIENEPNLTWHKQMHSLLQRMIHTAKRNRSGIPKEKIQKFTVMYEEILSKAFQEYQSNPPDKVYMDGYNLQKKDVQIS